MEKEQEPRFKVGDKVICIDDKNTRLVIGESYIVTRNYGYMININDENIFNSYSQNRFIPWCPAFESLFS